MTVRKSLKKANDRASPTSEALLEQAKRIISVGLGHLETEIRSIIDGTAKKTSHDPASRVAFLTKAAAMLGGEARKMVAREMAMARKLSPSLVMLYLRQQPKEEQQRIARELQIQAAGGGLLS